MIPTTSLHPLRYIGGMAALNLPSSTGTGDWHFVQTFERERQHRSRSFISGAGCLTDTTGLLGDAGIYEASELLRTLGIKFEGDTAYAANHARACADLVLAAVMRGLSPDFVRLDDWMPRESDKQAVYDLIDRALPRMDAMQAEVVRVWQGKQGVALRMRADAMAALLCVKSIGREAMADEVQQWIDWWQPSYAAAQRLSADEIAALKAVTCWPPATDRQVTEMPPQVAQRDVPNAPDELHQTWQESP